MSVFNFRNEFDGVNITLDQEQTVIAGQIVNKDEFVVTIEFDDIDEEGDTFKFNNLKDAYIQFETLVKVEVDGVLG